MVCPGEAQNPFEVWLSGILPSEKLRVAFFFFFADGAWTQPCCAQLLLWTMKGSQSSR